MAVLATAPLARCSACNDHGRGSDTDTDVLPCQPASDPACATSATPAGPGPPDIRSLDSGSKSFHGNKV
jgi:hypothetical protein